MRFQDWDVLLFPGDSQTPIQEFRTTCFALQDHRTHLKTPLLCCFIPSLTAGAPYQVSIHSWSKPVWILGAGNAGYVPGAKYLWQVRIVSDGEVVHKQEYPEDTPWPLQIATASTSGHDGKQAVLTFPPFHKDTTGQAQWYAADDHGRIKVHLSAGYSVETKGSSHFVRLVDHVVFSFQPAPHDMLQKAGIAWPNPSLPLANFPLQQTHIVPAFGLIASCPNSDGQHKRRPSLGGLPDYHDGSSRSTSAYTSYAAHPPLEPFALPHAPPAMHPPYPGSHHDSASPRVEVRMYSDQLRQIIEALSPTKQAQVVAAAQTAASTHMPPPPLPLHVTKQQQHPGDLPPFNPHSSHDRRAESRYSDVSMHAGCTAFPACTTEDAEGHVVHSSPNTTLPAMTVKGRKEGSSPNKAQVTGRDFLSTVMDQAALHDADAARSVPNPAVNSSPAEGGSARKRTRSALKSLTINDGSPEKKDKPPRKLSKASVASESDKENMMVDG